MSTLKVTVELDKEIRIKLEELASEMGISLAEWCALAIEHQVSMQKSIEELSGQMGFSLQEMDLEVMTNQLFSFFDTDEELEIDEIEQTETILLPSFKATTVKEND